MAKSISISNGLFTAVIATSGAELKSVQHVDGTEFMWQGDEKIWPRTAPVLFPIVGKVKDDVLLVNGQAYAMTQHGFARDMEFEVLSQDETSVKLKLVQDETTLKKYPFAFDLILGYAWENDSLVCSYEVNNPNNETLPFSIGAHPGFNTPGNDLSEYELVFEQAETQSRHLLSNGLFNGQTEPLLKQSNTLPLHTSLFDKDAIVFKQLESSWVQLKHRHSTYAVTMHFMGFINFGIWSKKGCEQFVCLEPWFGHADGVEGHTDIYKKANTFKLPPNLYFKIHYTLSFQV